MRWVKLILGCAWAAPTTLIGLLLALAGGARPYALRPAGAWWWVGEWGFWGWWYRPGSQWGAITFGQITIANPSCADDPTVVRHERVHLLQAFVLGPLFLPAYGLLSFLAWADGEDAYRGNPLEKWAYEKQSQPDSWG